VAIILYAYAMHFQETEREESSIRIMMSILLYWLKTFGLYIMRVIVLLVNRFGLMVEAG